MTSSRMLAGALIIAAVSFLGCETQPDLLGPNGADAPLLAKGGNGNPGGGGGDGVSPPPATVTVATPGGASLNKIECTGRRVGSNFGVVCDTKYQTVTAACFVNGAQIEIGLIEVEARKGANDRVIIHGMDGAGVEYWSGRVDITPVAWDGDGTSGTSFTIPANVDVDMTKQHGKANNVACPVSLGSMTYVFD